MTVRTEGKKTKEIVFHEKPKGQLEIAHSNQELTATELGRISAGPKIINFGTVV
jgi:hypothetical protein